MCRMMGNQWVIVEHSVVLKNNQWHWWVIDVIDKQLIGHKIICHQVVDYSFLLYLPTQLCFPIGGECVTCQWGKLTWLNLHVIRSCSLILQQNLCASQHQANDISVFFSFLFLSWEVNYLMTGSAGNSEFCFPETLNVPQGEAEGNIEVSLGASN